ASNLRSFDTTSDRGDWTGANNDAFNAFLSAGQQADMSARADKTVMDVIGWNVVPTVASWNVDFGDSWSDDGAWSSSSGMAPNGIDDTAIFPQGSPFAFVRSVTVDAPKVIGTMSISGFTPYVIGGATVTFDVSSGSAQLSAGGGGLTQINAPVTLNDDLAIFADSSTAVYVLSSFNAAGHSIVKSGAGVVLFQNLRANNLTVTAGAVGIFPKNASNDPSGTSVLKTLSITGGVFDLTNNALVVDYTGGSPIATIRQYLHDGKLSSGSATTTAGLGYGEASHILGAGGGMFAGQSVDGTAVLVKFTYFGDADLDGDADGVDIGTWATNFTGELGGAGTKLWTEGDWDYDGDVDGVDAGRWAQAFTGELGGGGLGSVVVDDPNIAPAAAAILRGMGITVVPEPAAMLGICLLSQIVRRRRRHRS
ncbi:MAG TPA: hypothetical protein VH518_20855, partial [Tepidisphaeraceae bacterium]